MKPLSEWPLAERRKIHGVFTDIDDTLTNEGVVSPSTVDALVALKAAGLHVIPVTGRPVGWSESFAAVWPVDAIVAENGAVALTLRAKNDRFRASDNDSLLSKIYQQDLVTRLHNQERMRTVSARIVREVPGANVSQDSVGRETDIAIDHSEFTQLPADKIAQVVNIMQSEGMNATVSSIHINGWYGDHNKLAGARWIVHALFGRDLALEMDRWAYVGDSTNDQLMFEAFTHSVGVANVRRFEAQLTHLPRYVTPSERGAGFAEFAQHLLDAR